MLLQLPLEAVGSLTQVFRLTAAAGLLKQPQPLFRIDQKGIQ